MVRTQILLFIGRPIYWTYICIYVYMYKYMQTLYIWICSTYIYTHTYIHRYTHIQTDSYTCPHIIYNIHKPNMYTCVFSLSFSHLSLSLGLSLSRARSISVSRFVSLFLSSPPLSLAVSLQVFVAWNLCVSCTHARSISPSHLFFHPRRCTTNWVVQAESARYSVPRSSIRFRQKL